MEKIVSDLMYLTELDTERMTDHFEIIDVSVLLNQLNEDFAAKFEEKDVLLTINADVEAKIQGEIDLVYRALSNVTENALKYTDKGAVEVKGHRRARPRRYLCGRHRHRYSRGQPQPYF